MTALFIQTQRISKKSQISKFQPKQRLQVTSLSQSNKKLMTKKKTKEKKRQTSKRLFEKRENWRRGMEWRRHNRDFSLVVRRWRELYFEFWLLHKKSGIDLSDTFLQIIFEGLLKKITAIEKVKIPSDGIRSLEIDLEKGIYVSNKRISSLSNALTKVSLH